MGWPVVIETESPAGTKEVAARLARICAPGDAILLIGDLGAGKTAFAQGFCRGPRVEGPVTSPTFALVRQYRCHGAGAVETLIHADVYRTGSAGEVVELALAELVEEAPSPSFEWGGPGGRRVGRRRLHVTLTLSDTGDLSHRTLSISGRGRWTPSPTRWPVHCPRRRCVRRREHRGHRDGDRDRRRGGAGESGVEAAFTLRGRRRHVETLAPAMGHLFDQVGLAPTDLHVVAVDLGPGSSPACASASPPPRGWRRPSASGCWALQP